MEKPDNTAQRTALWRALHMEIDAKPFIFEDPWALRLAGPDAGWQNRPDMKFTKPIRASIVGRARFVEDQVMQSLANGITQYVILGAGLDSFALRNPALQDQVQVFEIDQPDTLNWKREIILKHLKAIASNLRFVPVDFEKTTWWDALNEAKFDVTKPVVITCTGVTLYLSHQAIKEMLERMAGLAAGSVVIISFYAPVETLTGEDKALMEMSLKGAAASGTPMVSFFDAAQVQQMASEAGLKNCQTYDTKDLITRYFTGRSDGLLPNAGEIFLVATV